MQILASGIGLGVALVFAFGAVAKFGHRADLEVTLVRLLPPSLWRLPAFNSRVVASAVICGELGLAAVMFLSLITGLATPALLACAAVLMCFALMRERARRLRAPCGCARLSEAPTTKFDVVRIAVLGGSATFAGLLNPSLANAGATEWIGSSLVATATLAAVFPIRSRLRWSAISDLAATREKPSINRRRAYGLLSRRQFVAAAATTITAATVLPLSFRVQGVHALHEPECVLAALECEECCRGTSDPVTCDGCCTGCELNCIEKSNECQYGECDDADDCWRLYPPTDH